MTSDLEAVLAAGTSALWSAAQPILAEEKMQEASILLVEDTTLQETAFTLATNGRTLQDQGFTRLDKDRLRFQSNDWDLELNADSGKL